VPLDYANERYVRFYVRETPDEALWCWQARAVWPWLLNKAERSGELRTRKGVAGVAALIRLPIDVVEVGVAELLEDGCLVETDHGYAMPNYVEAQNAVASDTKRKADQRARDRLDESLERSDRNNKVTPGHAESRDVTSSHEKSLRAEPIRSEPSRTEEPPLPPKGGEVVSKRVRKAKASDLTPDERAIAKRVLDRLGERNGISYQGSEPHLKLIAKHLRNGITERELRGIAAYVWRELGWADKPEMHKHFRPETLFGPEKLFTYLDGARTWLAREHPEERARPPPEPAVVIDLFRRHETQESA
jgi:hypothetical protein